MLEPSLQLQSEIDLNTDKRHEHINKTVLDNFGEDANQQPTYNGNTVDTIVAQRDVYDGLDSMSTTVSLSARAGKDLNDNTLRKDNVDVYSPTTDYEPSTKKYSDDGDKLVSAITVNGVGTVGSYNQGDVIPLGTSMEELIRNILSVVTFDGYFLPTRSVIWSSSTEGTLSNNEFVEVGTDLGTITGSATITMNDATDGVDPDYHYTGTGMTTLNVNVSGAQTIATTYTMPNSNVVLGFSFDYGQAVLKQDSSGDDVTIGRFAEGSLSNLSTSLIAYQKSYFGTGTATNSAEVRGLVDSTTYNDTTFILNSGAVSNVFTFACIGVIVGASDLDANGVDLTDNFGSPSVVSVLDPQGLNGVNYNVYTYIRVGGTFSANHRLSIITT